MTYHTSVFSGKNIFKAAVIALMATVTIFTLMFGYSAGRVEAASYDTFDSATVSYASYLIQDGDSLWSIAEQFKYSGETTNSFIDRLKSVNSISSDDIHAGSYLLIPVYMYA